MKITASLLKECKENSRKAQAEVYRLCYGEAMKLAMRYTQNNEVAQEVMNSSFLKAFMNIHEFKGDENNFFGWLKKIIINKALDHIRSAVKYDRNVDLTTVAKTSESEEHPFDYDNIIHLIQKLPERSGAVFNLYAIEGYSHKEIATMMHITEANSKYHLHAARKSLKEWLFKTEKYER